MAGGVVWVMVASSCLLSPPLSNARAPSRTFDSVLLYAPEPLVAVSGVGGGSRLDRRRRRPRILSDSEVPSSCMQVRALYVLSACVHLTCSPLALIVRGIHDQMWGITRSLGSALLVAHKPTRPW